MGIVRALSTLLQAPIQGLLLVGLLWISASSAQTLEFKSAITQQTSLAGVTHAAWSPDGTHLYAVADQDHTLILFILAADGSLTFGQVLRDGVDGVDGLEGAIAVALSPAGDHVYVASTVDDAVAVFRRDAGTGELSFVEAVTDGINGVDGLNGATFVVVSPDGAHVYVAGSTDNAVATFSRDGTSGQLSFVQVFRRSIDMTAPRQLAISPDGATVYAAAPTSSSLVVLSRDSGTGMLSFVEFFKNYSFGAQDPHEFDGLFNISTVAVSPDGANVYVASPFDDTIATFERDGGTAKLTFSQILEDGVDGVQGLNGAVYLSVSPDGANVYVAYEIADNAGAAYVFVYDGENWQFQAKLTAADGESGDVFGLAVDVSGDFIVVGAPAAVGAAGPTVGGGAAYVFKRDGTSWTQDARLVGTLTVTTDAFDTPGNDNFGRAVAINGDVPAESTGGGMVYNVVVGAPLDNHSQSIDAGSAFLFQLSANGSAWNETAKLIANDPIGASGYGWAVDLDGDHMIIGAYNYGNGAYIFVRRGSQGVWGLETKVDGSGGEFGRSVAVFARSGRATFAVGSPYDDELGFASGAVYVLEGSTQPFDQQNIFTVGQAEYDRFGSDVAVLEGRVLATAITAPDNVPPSNGAAYLFKDKAGTWEQTHRFLGTDAMRMETIAADGDFALVGDHQYPSGLLDGLVFVFDGLDVVHSDGFESP